MTANNPNATLDTSRAPRGVIAATELVAAVAQIGDLAERHYLELKGPEDLDSKASKQKVAKFILGAANRMPDRAAEAFEGCAVMILGITKAGVVGLPPIEMLELNKVVEQHLGPNGPRWDIVRVPVKDSANEVLAVVVEPPKMGQPAWICRASGEGLTDGRVYIRADGETREATSAEQDLLRERGATATAPPVELDVHVTGEVTPIFVDQDRTLGAYIAKTRKRLLDALPRQASKVEAVSIDGQEGPGNAAGLSLADYGRLSESVAKLAQSAVAGAMIGSIPEKRTEAEYRKAIDDWEAELRAAWPKSVLQFASYLDSRNEVEIVNKTTTFLHDVEVSVHLDGDVITIRPRTIPDHLREPDIHLPTPPRTWGPIQRDFGRTFDPVLYMPSPGPGSTLASRSSWRNSGSVDIDVRVGDLRPQATFSTKDAESVLVIVGNTPEKVTGTWSATVRGYNAIFKGPLDVKVGKPRDLTAGVRAYFGLADDGIGHRDQVGEQD
ncbi:hypothetical protein ABCS02_27895 [Microbacterium sp. X-17]|uniref:hypothetical protein n=1 Tax=Microbacterium sp. X-17 TaxID=3144404 RepID=UPI0031F55068